MSCHHWLLVAVGVAAIWGLLEFALVTLTKLMNNAPEKEHGLAGLSWKECGGPDHFVWIDLIVNMSSSEKISVEDVIPCP